MKNGEYYKRGDRLGFIRFGSRVDIILPKDFKINVKIGDIVKNSSTTIGELSWNLDDIFQVYLPLLTYF